MKKVKMVIAIMLVMSIMLGLIACDKTNLVKKISHSKFESVIEKTLGKDIKDYRLYTVSNTTYDCYMLSYTDNFEITHNCELSNSYLYPHERYLYYEHGSLEITREAFRNHVEVLEDLYGSPTIEHQEDDYGYAFYVIDAPEYCEDIFNECSECQELFNTVFDLENTSVYRGYYYSGTMEFYLYHFADSNSALEEIGRFLDELGLPHSLSET